MPVLNARTGDLPAGPFDVIVVGSGAAALMAASRVSDLGASVLILEKTDLIGGNSATSGGGIWVPNNSLIAQAGIADSEEDAFSYLRSVIPEDQISDATVRTYVRSAPTMIEYLRQIGVPYSPVRKYPDYYPSVPGWKEGGRTMDCAPLDGRELGEDLYRLREMPPASKVFNRVNLSITEVQKIQAVAPGWQKIAMKALAGYAGDIGGRLKGRRDRRLCMGEALVGRLLLAVRKRGIDLVPQRAGTRPDRQFCRRDRRRGRRGRRRTAARHRSAQRRHRRGGWLRTERQAASRILWPIRREPGWSAGSPGNTGDLILAGREIGAANGLMNEAWWAPVVLWGDRPVVLFFEKSKPGMVIVDRKGRRFMNEAITYNSYGKCIYGEDYSARDRVPAFIIFDRTYREKYMFGGLLQASIVAGLDEPRRIRRGRYPAKGADAACVGRAIGRGCRRSRSDGGANGRIREAGVDEEFGRGSDVHDRQYGDEAVAPNPCLGPISQRHRSTALLSIPEISAQKAGWSSMTTRRCLTRSGGAIPGFFAAGNSTASIMGEKYPGRGLNARSCADDGLSGEQQAHARQALTNLMTEME